MTIYKKIEEKGSHFFQPKCIYRWFDTTLQAFYFIPLHRRCSRCWLELSLECLV